MAKCYYELRKQSARGSDSLVADMMRHFHAREYLGNILIVCEQPPVALSAARKQWLKLSRTIQKQRASTLNTDKILKYTHTIAHMQHLRFTTKTPLEDPEGVAYFLTEQRLETVPLRCFTVYISGMLSSRIAATILPQLPAEALIVDYTHRATWETLGLQPKQVLEDRVTSEWSHMRQFLKTHEVDIDSLSSGTIQDIEAMDEALDTLLGISHQFLQAANSFQHVLETARPLRLNKEARLPYDALALLAHRVQALSSEAYTQRFLETYNEDDSFFLYDFLRGAVIESGEALSDAVLRHLKAGRTNLAQALRERYIGRSFSPNTKPM
jgi:hypothetical protein